MKRYVKSKSDPMANLENNLCHGPQSTNANRDFDERWDSKFGEPSTEVFEPNDFKRWMQEVINFE